MWPLPTTTTLAWAWPTAPCAIPCLPSHLSLTEKSSEPAEIHSRSCHSHAQELFNSFPSHSKIQSPNQSSQYLTWAHPLVTPLTKVPTTLPFAHYTPNTTAFLLPLKHTMYTLASGHLHRLYTLPPESCMTHTLYSGFLLSVTSQVGIPLPGYPKYHFLYFSIPSFSFVFLHNSYLLILHTHANT